jgi:hypothetical protein
MKDPQRPPRTAPQQAHSTLRRYSLLDAFHDPVRSGNPKGVPALARMGTTAAAADQFAADTASATLSKTITLLPVAPTGFAKRYFSISLPPGLYGPIQVQIRAVSSAKGALDPDILIDVELQVLAKTEDLNSEREDLNIKEVVRLGQAAGPYFAHSHGDPIRVYGEGTISGNATNNGSGVVEVEISVDKIGNPW